MSVPRFVLSVLAVVGTTFLGSAETMGHVNLNAPNGGEVLQAGSVFMVEWRIVIAHSLLDWDLWYSTTGASGPWNVMASGPRDGKTHSTGWMQRIGRDDWSEDNRAELAKGWIKTADTLAELGPAIGLEAERLGETVGRWNAQAAAGEDEDFRRNLMLTPLDGGPYYAVELSPSMLNTQGGPERNEKGQIVRPDGTPIPRLYSAGELGSIYSYLYQGTGNIGECLTFGRISGRNAVQETPWS